MAEKKYIDSDHLLTALSVFNDYGNGNPHFLNGIRTAEEIIKDAPAADVRPVKRGEWVKFGDVHDRETGQEFPVFYCSKCGAINYIGNHYFCYFCGADMRPKEDNDG